MAQPSHLELKNRAVVNLDFADHGRESFKLDDDVEQPDTGGVRGWRCAHERGSHVGWPVILGPVDLAHLHLELAANRVPHVLGLFVLAGTAHNHAANRISKLRSVGPREPLLLGVGRFGLRAPETQLWVGARARGLSPELGQASSRERLRSACPLARTCQDQQSKKGSWRRETVSAASLRMGQ